MNGEAKPLIVEITNPQLANGTLTFDYKLLEGQDPTRLEQSYVEIDETFLADVVGATSMATGQAGMVDLLDHAYAE